MKETVELMFDGVLKECKVTKDRNGEYLCETEDKEFVKFPSKGDFDKMVKAYNEQNSEKVEAIPDMVYGEVTTFPQEPTPDEE
jgi:hypothetical protein